MAPEGLRLVALPGDYAVCRLEPGAEVPAPAGEGFFSVTHTEDETSVVCRIESAPAGGRSEGPLAALRVAGTLDFSLTGVLAGLTASLAETGISVFAISTFDTDYLLVPRDAIESAADALQGAGHEVSI